jgi:hypothetical protein
MLPLPYIKERRVMMRRILLLVVALLAVGTIAVELQLAEASPRSPRIEGSPSPRFFLESPEIESAELKPVHALDGTSLYRLNLTFGELRKPLSSLNVEYEIRGVDGTTAGGGMFTVAPEMLTPDKKGVSVLTGFGGLKVTPKHLLLVRVGELGYAPEEGRNQEKNITDTCTTYCDACADKAAALCSQGVNTYSCSCGPDTRACTFSCQSGKPQV